MFEVGFSEICMVALVALLVIGPEKLPKVARMTGFWVAKSRRMLASVKQEINEEFQLEELRQSLKNQSGLNEFHKILDDTSNDLSTIKNSVGQKNEFHKILDDTSNDLSTIKNSVGQKLEASHLTPTNPEQDERR